MGGWGVDGGSDRTGWLPHLTEQSSKQNVPTAVPKIRRVWQWLLPLRRVFSVSHWAHGRISSSTTSSDESGGMPVAFGRDSEQHGVAFLNRSGVRVRPSSQPTVQPGNILSYLLLSAAIRAPIAKKKTKLLRYSVSVPVTSHMFQWCRLTTNNEALVELRAISKACEAAGSRRSPLYWGLPRKCILAGKCYFRCIKVFFWPEEESYVTENLGHVKYHVFSFSSGRFLSETTEWRENIRLRRENSKNKNLNYTLVH